MSDPAFGGQLVPGSSPALLLVDVARAYLEPGSPLCLPAACEPLAALEQLLARARGAGVPVIWTRVLYTHPAQARRFRDKVPALALFEEGEPLGDFPPSLAPAEGEPVVVKHWPSGFFGTGLGAMLSAMAIDTLYIGGFSTSGCVRATALDALCHGFTPVVVADACGDRSQAIQSANLHDLGAKYAEVWPLERALGALVGP